MPLLSILTIFTSFFVFSSTVVAQSSIGDQEQHARQRAAEECKKFDKQPYQMMFCVGMVGIKTDAENLCSLFEFREGYLQDRAKCRSVFGEDAAICTKEGGANYWTCRGIVDTAKISGLNDCMKGSNSSSCIESITIDNVKKEPLSLIDKPSAQACDLSETPVECYEHVAVQSGKMEMCTVMYNSMMKFHVPRYKELLGDQYSPAFIRNLTEDCINKVSENFGSTLPESQTGSSMEECLRKNEYDVNKCYASMALQADDVNGCDKATNRLGFLEKSECYKTFALQKRDPKLCMKADRLRDYCFMELSTLLHDRSLCANIMGFTATDSRPKALCELQFMLTTTWTYVYIFPWIPLILLTVIVIWGLFKFPPRSSWILGLLAGGLLAYLFMRIEGFGQLLSPTGGIEFLVRLPGVSHMNHEEKVEFIRGWFFSIIPYTALLFALVARRRFALLALVLVPCVALNVYLFIMAATAMGSA